MKILADENCDRILVAELRSAGFDVVWVSDLAASVDDHAIFEMAASEGRLLVTNDQGFGLMAEQAVGQRPPAIVLMRLERLMPATRASIVTQLLKTAGGNLLGHFTVVEPHQTRSRAYKD